MAAVYEPSTDDRIDLIFRNLKEVRNENIVKKCLEVTSEVNVYWGTAPTGRIHIGYFFPMIKLADFLEAQCQVTILIADLHANLDNAKTSHTLQDKRSEYYEVLIKEMLKALGVPIDKLTFIRGTKFQLREDYTKAVFEMIRLTSTEEAITAVDGVINPSKNHLLASLVYPILQTLDEEFLDVDVEFGGEDQRNIFLYAEEKRLPSIAKRAHIMQQMIPGLEFEKGSAKREESKIDLLLPEEEMRKRIRKIDCRGSDWEKNTFLAFLKYLIPMKSRLKNCLNNYDKFEEIQNDFENNKLKVEDLVEMVESTLLYLIEPIKKAFEKPDMKKLVREAYPNHVPAVYVPRIDNTKNEPISKIDFELLKKEFPNVADKMTKLKVKDHPNIMWSCRCSGKPHIGYLIPIKKLATMSKGNWKVIILIEDVGAFLHSKYASNRPSWSQLEGIAKNYEEICVRAFELFGGKKENLRIRCGSEFQIPKSEGYMELFYQCLNKISLNHCRQILTEEMSRSLSSVIYTCMTAVDQLYLNTTVRLFGERNKSIDEQLIEAIECEEQMPLYVYHHNLPTLDGSSYMASPVGEDDLTSISIFDSKKKIKEKINKGGSNEILRIIEDIIWSMEGLEEFSINANANFNSINDIKDKIQSHSLQISDLRTATSEYLNDLIGQIRGSIISAFDRKDIDIPLCNTDDPNYINPNTMNLQVALVESVERKGNNFSALLSIGIKRFPLETECELTKEDLCLVSVQPGTSKKNESILGILKIHGGQPLNLMKYPYLKQVTFGNHEVSVPHCRLIDPQRLRSLINAHLSIKDKRLVWKIDGSFANEIELDIR